MLGRSFNFGYLNPTVIERYRLLMLSSAKHVSRSQFILAQRYKSKITIPLRCHIPLDTIPKTVQRKINKAEKYLNSLGVDIQKIQLPPISNINNGINNSFSSSSTDNVDQGSQSKTMKEDSIIDQTNALIVGSIHQYPQIAHYYHIHKRLHQ